MKVLLEEGVWLADGEGDPPRTRKEDNGKEFLLMSDALLELKKAREFRPFDQAQVVDDFI